MHAAEVAVVSPMAHHHPPQSSTRHPFQIDTNNLVIDDVKAEKVQHLEETVSAAALHLSLQF